MTVIDCVKSPPVDAMRAAGVTGLCRYLSWADQRDTLGKVIRQQEFTALRAAGFDVLLNWEYAAADYLGGATRGANHAQEAIRQARALGYPSGCAIVGSADHDVTRSDWLGTGRPYYMAFSSGLRVAGYRAGIYGPWDVLTWARDDNVADVFWQAGMSTAWSGGRNAQLWPGAHLRQRRNGFVGGFDVDFNDVIQANYGQYAAPIGLVAAESIEVDMFLAKRDDPNDGTIWLCSAMESRELTDATQLRDLLYLHDTGVIQLASGTNDTEWLPADSAHPRMIRNGYSPGVFGPVDTATQVVQVDASAVATALSGNADFLASVAKAVNDDAKTRRGTWA